MNLDRFNEWHQYLQRDILMEMCELFRPALRRYDSTRLLTIITRNPNFDRWKYSAAFPEIKWQEYMPYDAPPYSPEEFEALLRTTENTPSASQVFARVTESQLLTYLDKKYALIKADVRVSGYEMTIIARNKRISVEFIRTNTGYLWSFDECLNNGYGIETLQILAARQDITIETAQYIYELAEKYVAGLWALPYDPNMHEILEILHSLADNEKFSVDDVYPLFGPAAVMFAKQAFTKEHLQEPRFAKLRDQLERNKRGDAVYSEMCARNCNFGVPAITSSTIKMVCTNPALTPAHISERSARKIASDIVYMPSILNNQYTKHPYWNQECRRRSQARTAWLMAVWEELNIYVPNVLIELILESWFCGFGDSFEDGFEDRFEEDDPPA